MIKKYIGAGVIALGLAFSIGSATPAQAAALTSSQVQAVVSLLQSFGVDSNTIANVQVALGGYSTSEVSCSTFADLSYGNFDINPGGRVSQLQTWLGIASNTFGFGTYGPRTQALWNNKCISVSVTPTVTPPVSHACPLYQMPICLSGQHAESTNIDDYGCKGPAICVNNVPTQSCPLYNACPPGYNGSTSVSSNGCTILTCTPPVTTTSGSFSASRTSGAAPLTVTFSGSTGQSSISEVSAWIDFGDGSTDSSMGPSSFSRSHTYSQPGVYTARLQWRNFGPASSNFPAYTVGTVTISVAAN
jgi:hypothetical protein